MFAEYPSDAVAVKRAIVVEDDSVLREHLVDLVNQVEGVEVVGSAEGVESGQALLQTKPEILLVDLDLIDGSGVDLIRAGSAMEGLRILVVTVFGDEQSVMQAFEAGAHGFILKDTTLNEVSQALHDVLAGGAPISAAAAAHLLRRLKSEPQTDRAGATQSILTGRELELLQLLAKGLSHKEVAQTLGISPLTVGTHAKAIYRKMKVNGRGEAVFEAVSEGWIKLG
ncbi:MAG: response regulator transcription factor [Alphaproteobacteria bacterium]|nr:response regulator transcription factor [Alphaproteobacteria bacterium]